MIFRWFKSLQGRLTLLILFAVLVAQFISLTLIVPTRERQEHAGRERRFFNEAASMTDVFISDPQVQRGRYAFEAGSGGSFFWIAPQSIVPIGTSIPLSELPETSAALKQLESMKVQVRLYDDPRPLLQRYLPSPPPPVETDPANAAGRREENRQRIIGPSQGRPPPRFDQDGQMLPPPNGPRPPFADEARSPGLPPPRPSAEWNSGAMPAPPQLDRSLLWDIPGIPAPLESPVKWRIAVQLPDGQWLNGAMMWMPGGPPWLSAMLGQALVTAGLMLVLVIVAVNLATRRLKALAHHADRLGRGEDTEPLAERGPTEIQQVVRAFNTMNVRLRRFIESRTKMLGAISHDLRTPITALRIRAEFVEDEENRERMLVTLEEMKHLTESTLTLAKEDSVSEATKNVNLTALIESIEDDLTDAGQDVTCTAEQDLKLACRPHSLKRAIRNLAENGVKYGDRARVAMTSDSGIITIHIDDDGPGIPEEKRDQVFMPFVRLEESRNKETGGVGLGLAICRSIIHSHGGDLQMDNRDEGGLRVTVRLPRNGSELIGSPDAILKE